MLILWRRSGQSLIVGDEIEIQVLDAGPNRVKLGIVAPAAVSVYRKEAQATREHNIAAAASADRKTMEKLVRMACAASVPAVSARVPRQIIDGTLPDHSAGKTTKKVRTHGSIPDMDQ